MLAQSELQTASPISIVDWRLLKESGPSVANPRTKYDELRTFGAARYPNPPAFPTLGLFCPIMGRYLVSSITWWVCFLTFLILPTDYFPPPKSKITTLTLCFQQLDSFNRHGFLLSMTSPA